MELRLDKSEILYYESKYDADYDKPIKCRVDNVKDWGYLKMPDLLALSIWKAKERNTHNIEKNSDSVVEEMTKLSLAAETEEDRINYLCRLHGVRLPVASAILHWFHNDDYPIYSDRALETVEVEKKTNTPPFDEWMRYVSFCRRIAKENEIDMRTLDRALWQYSKEQSE